MSEAFTIDSPAPGQEAFAADPWPAKGHIETYADGSFEWADDSGLLAHILPVPGLGAAMDDVLAWAPEDPGRWWLRRRVGVILGLAEIERSDYLHDPLHLFWTPQDWLDASKNGAVILDWQGCCLSFWLPSNAPIKCQDKRLARKVTAALAPLPLDITVEAPHA